LNRPTSGTTAIRASFFIERTGTDSIVSLDIFSEADGTKKNTEPLYSPIPFMSLFRCQDLVDNKAVAIRIEEYDVFIGDMHPVALLGGIQPLDIPMRIRMIDQTINMVSYDTAVFPGKSLKKLLCPDGDPETHVSLHPEIPLCLVPRDDLFGCIDCIEIGNEF